jgi:hypothetical protein
LEEGGGRKRGVKKERAEGKRVRVRDDGYTVAGAKRRKVPILRHTKTRCRVDDSGCISVYCHVTGWVMKVKSRQTFEIDSRLILLNWPIRG